MGQRHLNSLVPRRGLRRGKCPSLRSHCHPGAPEGFPSHLQPPAMLWGDGKFGSLWSLIHPLNSSDKQFRLGLTEGNSKPFSCALQHGTGQSPALPGSLDGGIAVTFHPVQGSSHPLLSKSSNSRTATRKINSTHWLSQLS